MVSAGKERNPSQEAELMTFLTVKEKDTCVSLTYHRG